MRNFYTNTLKLFDKDWALISGSPKTRSHLAWMAKEHHLLQGLKPSEIIHIIGNTKDISRHKRDPILLGLFDFVTIDELAGRLILQSLRPQVVSLVHQMNYADAEERASSLFSIAAERIMIWHPRFHEFCHWRLYMSVTKNAVRLSKKWQRWNINSPQPDFADPKRTDLVENNDIENNDIENNDIFSIPPLIQWVKDICNTDATTAEVLVLTRIGHTTISAISESLRIDARTLRQRRRRAEIRLKERLPQPEPVS